MEEKKECEHCKEGHESIGKLCGRAPRGSRQAAATGTQRADFTAKKALDLEVYERDIQAEGKKTARERWRPGQGA
ncbi:hypothetical protein [Geoalkalibacter halelectricus]|uniref:hypothetical protein n=1 Tax=Geoalkalibacter halelectricus TaxID=2847045 RepID=UPI00266FF08C|nr:hypothetical protein [Geoalkalibacter halelectricus]